MRGCVVQVLERSYTKNNKNPYVMAIRKVIGNRGTRRTWAKGLKINLERLGLAD